MVNNQHKSTCQLRLEARSLAYQQKQQHNAPTTSVTNADGVEAYVIRIQRATEMRTLAQRQRRAHARARVLHAQRVASETRAKRRDAGSKSRAAAQKRLDIASARRATALLRTQNECKRRVDAVLEKVESLKEIQRYREARQRRELEMQLVEAARRREEQTQSLVRRLSQRWQCVESVKDRVQRAKFIQRWYRRHVDARATAQQLQSVKAELHTVVSAWQAVGRCSFDESIAVMQARALAPAAQAVLRVLLPSNPSSSSPRGLKNAPFRVLLLVGMLVAHPQEIMEQDTCERLRFAATAVRRAMEAILSCLQDASVDQASVLTRQVTALNARFAFYFECFSQWKDRDAERLASNMLQSYVEIFATSLRYASVAIEHPDDGMHQLKQETQRQLVQLRKALAQVLGKDEALQRVARIEQRCRAQVRTSASSTRDREGTGSERSSSDEEMEGEPSPGKPQEIKPVAGKLAVASTTSEEASSSIATVAAPPAEVARFLGDAQLVHELILNPSFRLPQDPPAESLAGRVRTSMVKAFWDHAIEANDVATLLTHLQELATAFAHVVPAPSLVNEVGRALDTSTLQRLLEDSTAHYDELRARCLTVLQAIRRAEAPFRNDATDRFLSTWTSSFASLSSSNAPSPVRVLVEFLAFARAKVDELRLDLVNTHLGVLSSYLQLHGRAYEQQQFQKALANGASFPQTTQWLKDEATARFPRLPLDLQRRMRTHDAAAFSTLLRRSMLGLVLQHIAGSTDRWPETFVLDVARLRGFRDTLDRVTVVAAMVAVVQDFARPPRVPLSRAFLMQLRDELNVLLQSPDISGSHVITHAMDKLQKFQNLHNLPMSEEASTALTAQLLSSFQASNPIFELFGSRVASAVQSFVETDRETWTVHPSLQSFEELETMAVGLRTLCQHNERVYAVLYNAILRDALASRG